ncbi:hypothetical protein CF327_g3367 [Tilletia walkeri]|nr:hypothetical protein CF327_g3367 [Tilletia walkeri]
MPLTTITEPPRFVRPDSDEPTERATPGTFVGLPPTLRTLLEGATALLDPGLSDPSAQTQTGAFPQWKAQGNLYVTNDSLSFLDPTSNKGFSVDFPTISLHAISRSIPEAIQAIAQASGSTACLYCQLDDNAGKDDENDANAAYGSGDAEGDEGMEDENEAADDDVNTLRELWLLPQQPDQLEPLFDMLSYCASLHPSLGTEEGDTGHPFASLGPFGTGSSSDEGMLGVGGPVLDLSALSAEGAFDDAMEDTSTELVPNGVGRTNGEGVVDGLSDTGRAVLARLEGSIEWPEESINNTSSTRAETIPSHSNPTETPTKPSRISNTLILTSLPDSLFQAPELLSSLLDLLHAYGPLQSWTPLPSMGRALVVFEDGIEAPGLRREGELTRGQESARRAKEALDKLLWGFEEDVDGVDQEDEDEEALMEWPPRKAEGKAARNGSAMRVYHGPPSSILLASDSEDALAVPTTDKNFLISPPGSPPVGWEPIKEDPPNRDTLAWDLIKALGDLRDQGGAVESWKAAPLVDENGSPQESSSRNGSGNGQMKKKMGHGRKGSLGPPSLVIPPSEAKISRRQAASLGSTQPRPTPFMDRIAQAQPEADADGTYKTAEDSEDAVLISVPGVTVQAFEDGSDDEDAERRARLQPRTGMSISSVKATVESMYSSGASPSMAPVVIAEETGEEGSKEAEESMSALRLDMPAVGGLSLGGALGAGEGGGKRITPTGRPPLA